MRLVFRKSIQGQFVQPSGKLPNVLTTMPQGDDQRILTLSAESSTVEQPVIKARKLEKRRREHGLAISIETARGSTREGKDPHGVKWKTVMPFDYGYIRGTLGLAPDGDHLDCVSSDTRILLSDLTEKRAGELALSDALAAFDKKPEKGRTRKFRKAEIEALERRVGPMLRFYLESGDVVECTPGHQWLAYEGKTKTTVYRKAERMKVGQRLVRVQRLNNGWKESSEYCIGYLMGITEGDGYFKFDKNSGAGVWRLGLSDFEPLYRCKEYLEYLGCTHININDVSKGGYSEVTKKKMRYIKTARLENINLIRYYFERCDKKNVEWCRGFVAGFFDAEGGIAGHSEVTVTQSSLEPLQEYMRALAAFDLQSTLRESSGRMYPDANGTLHPEASKVVLKSSRDNSMLLFFHLFGPSIQRKLHHVYGRQPSWLEDRIVAIEEYIGEYVAIQTSTQTYIANGLASHNCTIGPEKDPTHVWVFHIKDPITKEDDEDKVYMNFKTKQDAIAAFRRSYDHPDRFLNEKDDITEYTKAEFLTLIKKVIQWKVAETSSHKLNEEGKDAIHEKHEAWKEKKNGSATSSNSTGSFSLVASSS